MIEMPSLSIAIDQKFPGWKPYMDSNPAPFNVIK
jgi:hypothetical protein